MVVRFPLKNPVPSITREPELVIRSSACKVPPEIVAKLRDEPVRAPLSVSTVPFSARPWPATYVVLLSVALIVMLSAPASVVMVTFVPATSVSVSVVPSATTLLCPETASVWKRFWSAFVVSVSSLQLS